MRKRSDAGAVVSAVERTVDMFPKQEAKPAPIAKSVDIELPPRVSFQDGLPFVHCECGLIQGLGTAAGKEKVDEFGDKRIKFECISCFADVDPDGAIDQWCRDTKTAPITKSNLPPKIMATKPAETPVLKVPPEITKLAEVAVAAQIANPITEWSKQHAAAQAKKAKPEPLGFCETPGCGKEITKTNIGFFYACGHDPRMKENSISTSTNQFADTLRQVASSFENSELAKELPEPDAKGKHHPIPFGELDARRAAKNTNVTMTGRTVTVTLGKLTFTPKSFNTFEVGPFTASVEVPSGTPDATAAAARGLLEELENIREEEFRKTLKRFKSMLNEMCELYGPKG